MIVFIHHSFNPYRVAFFNELAETDIKFTVLFLSKPAKNRKWKLRDYNIKFKYKVLEGKKFYVPGNDHSYFQLNLGIWNELGKINPDIVITIGWNYLASYIALLYCKLKGSKFVTWSESTKYEKSIQRSLTKPLVQLLVKNSDFLIAAGTRAKVYLVSLGAKENKIDIAYYTIDTKKLIKQVRTFKNNKSCLRIKHGINKGQKIVLFVGGLLKRKGVINLLQVANILRCNKDVVFLLVGFGPLASEVEKYIKQKKLKNVIMAGFVPNEKIMEYFVACDLFILPSLEETWGLVVNEAMCAGKAVYVSKYAGSSADLVEDRTNGRVIDPRNPRKVSKMIAKDLKNSKRLIKYGKKSLGKIKVINIKQNVDVVLEINKRLIK